MRRKNASQKDRQPEGGDAATPGLRRIRHCQATATPQSVTLLSFLALLSFLSILAVPEGRALTITTINAPANVAEGEELRIGFTTDQPATYQILEDNVLVSTTNEYAARLGYDEAGIRTYTLIATTTNETINETRTIEITNTPLQLIINEPSRTDYATTTIPISVATSIPAELCYTVIKEETKLLNKSNETLFTGTRELGDGVHAITIKCKRGDEIAEESVTLKIDTTPPTVTLKPSGTIQEEATLTVTTDEVSTCAYATSPAPYEEMTLFPTNPGLAHAVTLSLDEGSHTYHARCRDVYGNEAPLATTTFTFQRKPTARITIEGENPRRAGTYDLLLEVSEPLRETPSLTLTYQGGGTTRLALEQEDEQTYKGVIIIPENAGERVASFSFSGTDLDGLTGTTITKGGLLIIDTLKPPRIETFSAVNGTGYVNLTWYYEGEEALFNIYRSEKPGVTLADYLATTSQQKYQDRDVKGAVNYYYRVAAVDKAGNTGELSKEEYAAAAASLYKEEMLDPVLQAGLEEELRIIESWILDAERALKNLKGEDGKEEAGVIRDLHLITEAEASLAAFKKGLEELQALRKLALTTEEFRERVTRIKLRMEEARERLPLTITITGKTEYDELPDEQTITSLLARIPDRPASEEERAAHERETILLNEKSRIRTSVTTTRVTYASGKEEGSTLITKHVTLDEQLEDAIIIEQLPVTKEKVLFPERKPLLLDERTARYSFSRLEDETLAYVVTEELSAPAARRSSLIIAPKPRSEGAGVPAATRLSGNALSSPLTSTSLTTSQLAFLVLGSLTIAGLLTYYLRLRGEEPPREVMSAPPFPPRGGARLLPQAPQVPGVQQLAAAPSLPPTASRGGWQEPLQAPLQTLVITRKEEPLAGLLLKGHKLIDEGRYLDALHFYKEAVKKYSGEPFPSAHLQEAVRQELELLHAKLSLFNAATRAHDAAYAEDAALLREEMRAMRRHASTIADREPLLPATPLIEKMKAEYRYLHARLQGILAAEERTGGRGEGKEEEGEEKKE